MPRTTFGEGDMARPMARIRPAAWLVGWPIVEQSKAQSNTIINLMLISFFSFSCITFVNFYVILGFEKSKAFSFNSNGGTPILML